MTAQKPVTIKLKKPLKLGDDKVREIALRPPSAGELRGLKLVDVLQMDVAASMTLIRRIGSPSLAPSEIESMDPRDLSAAAQVLVGFFASDEDLAAVEQA